MRSVTFHPTFPKALMALAYTRCARGVAVFPGGPVAYQEIDEQALPTQNHVRVRCHLAGICGSDLSLLRFRFSMHSATMARKRTLTRPICLGHEAMGEVIETGAEVRSLNIGQRVVLLPGASCSAMQKSPPCAFCADGLPLLCRHRDDCIPSLADGAAWSTHFVRHESQLLKIPDRLSAEDAVLIEPLACSAHAVLRRPPSPGDRVIVIGCGTIGLGIILALRALSIPLHIIAIARHAHQKTVAESLGANRVLDFADRNIYNELASELGCSVLSRGQGNQVLHSGANRVYDVVGSSGSIAHALRWVAPRGAVVIEGIHPAPSPRDCSPIWLREIDVLGAHGHGMENHEGCSVHTFQIIIDWLTRKKINPGALITNRLPLGEFKTALRMADAKGSSGAIKILLNAANA